VRTQLESVFLKVGVSSQAALVRLLANASEALRSRRP
jgi:DNA-binding CsgD family transcriptional regulator